MKNSKIIVFLIVVLFSASKVFSQLLPGDPGYTGAGGSSVPLDGGILLVLLAAGGIGASLFAKSKKKDK
jgi:hypothetical protein